MIFRTDIVLLIAVHIIMWTWVSSVNDCGIAYQRKTYIMGGSHVTEHSWPWTVSIRDRSLDGRTHFCGGVLIEHTLVLTAAHCMFDTLDGKRERKAVKNLLVAVGVHGLSDRQAGEKWLSVSRIHIHPFFDSSRLDAYHHDLALLQLHSPISDNMRNICRPVCLPEWRSSPLPGIQCVVTGWGYDVDMIAADSMRQTQIPIISQSVCREKRFWSSLIESSMFCAGVMDGDRRVGICEGDSGGPLFCSTDGHTWTVEGVVSWGAAICLSKPGVFASVAHMRPWIDTILNTYKLKVPKRALESRGRPVRLEKRECRDLSNWQMISRLRIRAPSPLNSLSKNVSLSRCIHLCCNRSHECDAVQYFSRTRKCLLLMEGVCTVPTTHVVYPTRTHTLYIGRLCSE